MNIRIILLLLFAFIMFHCASKKSVVIPPTTSSGDITKGKTHTSTNDAVTTTSERNAKIETKQETDPDTLIKEDNTSSDSVTDSGDDNDDDDTSSGDFAKGKTHTSVTDSDIDEDLDDDTSTTSETEDDESDTSTTSITGTEGSNATNLTGIASTEVDQRLLIFFNFGSRHLSKKSVKLLGKLQISKKSIVYIYGYSDSIGSAKANYSISLRRANSVLWYLRKHNPNALYIIKAFGQRHPRFSNKTAWGRKLNRRVFVMVKTFDKNVKP